MLIKEIKDSFIVGVQKANAMPSNGNGYTYSEITQAEYDAILADFASRETPE